MQPFDRGKFDQRYVDTFSPAIKAAGFEPYRVDEDPAASIPIDEIERQIRSAAVCFAEITTDNPNVWFELGYSLACKKELCLICSSERVTRFPFDVQHRQIIKYETNSASDFERLGSSISTRLEAIAKKAQSRLSLEQSEALAPTSGLSPHEITALVAILEARFDPSSSVSIATVIEDMGRFGFTKTAAQLALERLRRKTMVTYEIKLVSNQWGDESEVTFFQLTDKGLEWLLENEDQLQLNLPDPPSKPALDNDIPF